MTAMAEPNEVTTNEAQDGGRGNHMYHSKHNRADITKSRCRQRNRRTQNRINGNYYCRESKYCYQLVYSYSKKRSKKQRNKQNLV